MSDDSIPSPEEAPTEEFEKPKVRRISNKNPRKTAKDKKVTPESEAASSEEPSPQNEGSSDDESDNKPEQKRNNRRRRGKKPSKDSSDEETINLGDGDSQSQGDDEKHSRDQGRSQQKKKARSNVDPEKAAKKAWKIYLAEVSEEGVALIGDNDARDLARRCFRLAELFLEEEERRG